MILEAEVIMIDTKFLDCIAHRKSNDARNQICWSVSRSIRPVVSQSLGGHLATSQGYGLGAGSQGLGAQGLGPGPPN